MALYYLIGERGASHPSGTNWLIFLYMQLLILCMYVSFILRSTTHTATPVPFVACVCIQYLSHTCNKLNWCGCVCGRGEHCIHLTLYVGAAYIEKSASLYH